MQFQRFGLRFRRKLKQTERQVEDLGTQAERGFEQYFFKRFGRLKAVRRFVIGWVLLLAVLIFGVIGQNFSLSNYYQTLRPVPGGIYNTGVLGTFSTANPLYATSDADETVSHLVFAGLFSYDQQNQLVGDLASGYSVDPHGTVYTVTLKPGLTWQDGKPLTSADVVYTYQAIQNPDAQSPLQASWQGITVKAVNPTTVTFTLSNALTSFPDTLTNGIIPEHILGSIAPADLRTADFNTVNPIGAGPFSWAGVQVSGTDPASAEEQVALKPFPAYQGGAPKLQEFVVHAYAKQDKMTQDFVAGQLNGASGFDSVPAAAKHLSGLQQHSFLLTAGTYVFFKTSTGILSDTKVRQALLEASNEPEIISQLGFTTRPVTEPLLTNQLAYNPAYKQGGYNLTAAAAILTADGWVAGSDGIRTKNNQPLSFTLSAQDTASYRTTTNLLKQQWRQLGVDLHVDLQTSDNFQTTLSYHDYDAVLYGISIGVDPDVYVYWDSSQADIRAANRLNLSEWKNPIADTALESGRTRLDPALRTVKYQPFLQAWQQDVPAIGLYQPRYLYLSNGPLYGLNDMTLNAPTDRFANVQNWEIREAKVTD